MSPFWLKFSQMILHTETSKLMYNWSFLFVILHKPTLLPSTFKSLKQYYLGKPYYMLRCPKSPEDQGDFEQGSTVNISEYNYQLELSV